VGEGGGGWVRVRGWEIDAEDAGAVVGEEEAAEGGCKWGPG